MPVFAFRNKFFILCSLSTQNATHPNLLAIAQNLAILRLSNKFGGKIMGAITLIILLAVEAFFLVWTIKSKSNHAQEKSIVRIAELALFGILSLTGVLEWGFRYIVLLAVLVVQAIIGVIVLVKKTEKLYKPGKSIRGFISNGFIYAFALFLAILCPQYTQPAITGSYEVATAKYTWVDENRIETFADTGENRALTVEFWYPQEMEGKAPLVVFSHGAFGFGGSNYSTFAELASNGYVVASISHTYHAFYTMDTSGRLTTVNIDFLNSVNAVNATDDPEQDYYVPQEWMNLRVADAHFVLDTITANVNAADKDDALFSSIDLEHIGMTGHSLGGAMSAQMGRERDDIDAVIVLDGTMLGERIEFENGKVILNDTPYPVPLLNVYAEDHYQNAVTLVGEEYENFYAQRNAVNASEVVIRDAGHLNFTDLPLFSPALAKMLGVGTVDKRYCIEKTNSLVLEFFNCYLKGGETPDFEREY